MFLPPCDGMFSKRSRFLLLQKLRPRGLELQQGELGDLVEQEMAATSTAVESAATRIEVNTSVFISGLAVRNHCPLVSLH